MVIFFLFCKEKYAPAHGVSSQLNLFFSFFFFALQQRALPTYLLQMDRSTWGISYILPKKRYKSLCSIKSYNIVVCV